MADTFDLSQINDRLRNNWLMKRAIPAALYQDGSPIWAAQRKNIRQDLSGEAEMRYPTDTALPGAGGANITDANTNASGPSYDRFIVAVEREWYQVAYVSWNALRFSKGRNNYGPGGALMWTLMGHAKRYHNIMGVWLWGNGGGAVARLRAGQVLTPGVTQTLQLDCERTAIRFEEARPDRDGNLRGGDVVQFSVDDGTGGAGVKAFESRVIGVNWDAGTITLETPVDATIADTDFVFYRSSYGNVFRGMFAWCPSDVNDLTGTFFNVDRATSPQKLGGVRVKLTTGQDPYTEITKIAERAQINGVNMDTLVTTPENTKKIRDSLRQQNIKSEEYTRSGDMKYMQQDLKTLRIANPVSNGYLDLVSDKYLADISAPRTEQNIYRGFNSQEWTMHTTSEGISWANFDGNGPVYQLPGTATITASHGCVGEFQADAPRNLLVASPSVIG